MGWLVAKRLSSLSCTAGVKITLRRRPTKPGVVAIFELGRMKLSQMSLSDSLFVFNRRLPFQAHYPAAFWLDLIDPARAWVRLNLDHAVLNF